MGQGVKHSDSVGGRKKERKKGRKKERKGKREKKDGFRGKERLLGLFTKVLRVPLVIIMGAPGGWITLPYPRTLISRRSVGVSLTTLPPYLLTTPCQPVGYLTVVLYQYLHLTILQ